MRILFSVRKPSNVRHYDSVLRMLAARGHEIELVKEPVVKTWPPFVLALPAAHPNVRLSSTPSVAKNPWWELSARLRRGRFYLRFLEPRYRDAPALLERARKRAPRSVVRLASWIGDATSRRLLARVVGLLERSTHSARLFHDYLLQQRPDLVILTPLVVLETTQLDLAQAAADLGIRNVFGVASWDHLSSKGQLSVAPQQIILWNDVQKREAVELHGVDPDRVVITGAQVFDDWFEQRPSTTREAFCARVGLRPDRPIVLYVCSSLLEGSPPERSFVLRWLRHLRSSGHPVLEECGVLVRPHYQVREIWNGAEIAGFDNVACWPPLGDAPVDSRSKTDYFDSMYHAAAVVGLNTSAMIEAAIVGRPVHAVLLPEFRDNQEGTLHFHYLLDPAAPLLRTTRSLDDHARQLAETVGGRDPDPDRSERFVRTFVRPGPSDTPATIRFVEAVEALGARPALPPAPAGVWTYVIRPILWPFAKAAERRALRIEGELRRLKEQRRREHREKKQVRMDARRRQRLAARALTRAGQRERR